MQGVEYKIFWEKGKIGGIWKGFKETWGMIWGWGIYGLEMLGYGLVLG